MEKEYRILTYLDQQDLVSQRDISKNTGIGLGTVNLILKKMIKKGLVKIERLNARSLRYILTPKGLKEKTERTYNYVKHSYNHILKVMTALDSCVETAKAQGIDNIYIYGPRDEILEIMATRFKQEGVKYDYIQNDEDLPPINSLVLVWQIVDEKRFFKDYQVVNILHQIE